jgi:hypothetical protein
MTITEIMQQAKSLSLQERRELVKLLNDSLQQVEEPKKHSILELAGLGAEVWQGIDPQEYINQLRSEWDERP